MLRPFVAIEDKPCIVDSGDTQTWVQVPDLPFPAPKTLGIDLSGSGFPICKMVYDNSYFTGVL